MNTVHLCWYDSSRFLPFFTCHFFHLLALKTKMRKTRLKCFAHGLAPLRTSATFHNSLSDEATARRVSTVPFVAYSRATRDLDFRRLMKNVADFLRSWGSFYVACLVFWKTFPVTWKVFAFFGGTSHGVSHVIIKAVESISPPNKNSLPKKKAQKKNLRNTCDTSSTIFSEIPSISPLHPPCLQMSRNLSLKAAQAADLNIKHTPEFYGDKKTERTFPLQAHPQKRIPFKSPPCSEGELLVQVTFEVSMFYQRITNIIWEVLPNLFITVSWDHNLNHCRCLPMV